MLVVLSAESKSTPVFKDGLRSTAPNIATANPSPPATKIADAGSGEDSCFCAA